MEVAGDCCVFGRFTEVPAGVRNPKLSFTSGYNPVNRLQKGEKGVRGRGGCAFKSTGKLATILCSINLISDLLVWSSLPVTE